MLRRQESSTQKSRGSEAVTRLKLLFSTVSLPSAWDQRIELPAASLFESAACADCEWRTAERRRRNGCGFRNPRAMSASSSRRASFDFKGSLLHGASASGRLRLVLGAIQSSSNNSDLVRNEREAEPWPLRVRCLDACVPEVRFADWREFGRDFTRDFFLAGTAGPHFYFLIVLVR